jgi:hypothetical protein
MASNLISEVSNHVQFLGYTVEKIDETSYGAVPAKGFTDQIKPSFTFHQHEGGIFFLCGFRTSEDVKKDVVGFLRFVNEANNKVYLTRFTWNPEFEAFYGEGYYASIYDKQAFGTFITTWLNEITSFLSSHKSQVKKYLTDRSTTPSDG